MAKLSELGEWHLISRIEHQFRHLGRLPRAGIGEDAAIIRATGSDMSLSTDFLLEGVHFRRREFPPDLLGWKALAVNLSDLAAVGARPVAFLLLLGLPPGLQETFFRRFLTGLTRLSRRYRLRLLGGDTCAFSKIVIGIAVIGSLRGGRYLPRSGARPGDQLFVSGPLGGSSFGLRLLRRGWRLRGGRAAWAGRGGKPAGPDSSRATRALRAHLQPDPPVVAGQALADRRIASAAIDISDGLSTDLVRLCDASRTGALLDAELIPTSPSLAGVRNRRQILDLALHGGEDYEILISVPPRRAALLERGRFGGRRFLRIGEIRPRRFGVRIRTPERRILPLPRHGFRHFSP